MGSPPPLRENCPPEVGTNCRLLILLLRRSYELRFMNVQICSIFLVLWLLLSFILRMLILSNIFLKVLKEIESKQVLWELDTSWYKSEVTAVSSGEFLLAGCWDQCKQSCPLTKVPCDFLPPSLPRGQLGWYDSQYKVDYSHIQKNMEIIMFWN